VSISPFDPERTFNSNKKARHKGRAFDQQLSMWN
jgi:hypothetical protein